MDEARRREEEMEAFRAGGGSFMERVSSGIYRDTRTGHMLKDRRQPCHRSEVKSE